MSEETRTIATPEEMETRLDYIQGMIVNGVSQTDFVRHARKHLQDWGITSDRHFRRLYKMSLDRFAEETGDINRAANHVINYRRLELLYFKATAANDLKTAASCIMEMNKMQKLSDPGAWANTEWRTTAKQAGMKIDELFEQTVQMFLNEGDKGSHAANLPIH